MKSKKTKLKAVAKPRPRRILVVEDDRDLCEQMVRIFQLGGYDVSGAPDGFMALNALKQAPVDLVLTDVLMPQMDGFALASYLEEKYPALPLIVMSGTRSHSAQFSGPSRANVRKFLLKPVSLDVLINSVLEILQ